MRAFLIFMLWLLLGWFFYSMKKNCCDGTTPSAKSATILPSTKTSTDVATIDSDTSLNETTTTQAPENDETGDSVQTSNQEDKSYDYNTSMNIQTDGAISLIPASDEKEFDDELQALLENTCTKLRNNLSKVMITSYAENQSSRMRKMENILIRCGLSPGRVNYKYSSQENEDYANKIVFKIVD